MPLYNVTTCSTVPADTPEAAAIEVARRHATTAPQRFSVFGDDGGVVVIEVAGGDAKRVM